MSAAPLSASLCREDEEGELSPEVAGNATVAMKPITTEEASEIRGCKIFFTITFTKVLPTEGLKRFHVVVGSMQREGDSPVQVRSQWAVGVSDYYLKASVVDLTGGNKQREVKHCGSSPSLRTRATHTWRWLRLSFAGQRKVGRLGQLQPMAPWKVVRLQCR